MVVLASTSSASVRFGHTPVRNPAALTAWSPTWLPGCERVRLVTTTAESANGSSGLRMGVNSKPAPTFSGIHWSTMAPFGMYTAPNRGAGAAAVFAVAVKAGTMASRNGSATVAPMPRRNVRRGKDSLEMNIAGSTSPPHRGG